MGRHQLRELRTLGGVLGVTGMLHTGERRGQESEVLE
jgi:hypothetical protein